MKVEIFTVIPGLPVFQKFNGTSKNFLLMDLQQCSSELTKGRVSRGTNYGKLQLPRRVCSYGCKLFDTTGSCQRSCE